MGLDNFRAERAVLAGTLIRWVRVVVVSRSGVEAAGQDACGAGEVVRDGPQDCAGGVGGE
jgi:hypothetical protein